MYTMLVYKPFYHLATCQRKTQRCEFQLPKAALAVEQQEEGSCLTVVTSAEVVITGPVVVVREMVAAIRVSEKTGPGNRRGIQPRDKK